jgi:hypothetical protein
MIKKIRILFIKFCISFKCDYLNNIIQVYTLIGNIASQVKAAKHRYKIKKTYRLENTYEAKVGQKAL